MPKLKQPLKFSVTDGYLDIREWMDRDNEIDSTERRITGIDIREDEGMFYIHWEEGGD